jgi:hypothetical protein
MPNEVDRWKNRRHMAWVCMVAGVGYPLLVLGTNSRELGEIAVPFYMFIASVVGAYIGFATIDDRWQKQGRMRNDHQYDDPMDRSGRDYRNNIDYTNARF